MFQLKSKSKRLISIFDELDKASQQSLLDFAEFLQNKATEANGEDLARIQEPNLLPIQAGESVIVALKRLSASYPMLDKSKLLSDTSVLVTEHTLQGRDREEVIAELDLVFKQHYQNYVDEGTKE